MPSRVSNGAQGVTPVYVEVKPKDVGPSTPPASPKAVRFAPSSQQEVSRPLTNAEEWSTWHFENHASKCRSCYDPYRIYQKGGRLCSEGHALAQDVAINILYKSGVVYATRKEDHKLVRVELKPGYWHVMALLRSMDHHLRGSSSGSRRSPVISYDKSYPVSARYQKERTAEYQPREKRETVIVEPASSKPERRRSTRRRYEPKEVDEDIDNKPVERKYYKERRGSLYETEMERLAKEKKYRVEVREPERRRRRDGEERRRDRYD